jgi:hypothetical protein
MFIPGSAAAWTRAAATLGVMSDHNNYYLAESPVGAVRINHAAIAG